ncbi:hypothetical protein STEG23_002434 [Scotinomys teguina]
MREESKRSNEQSRWLTQSLLDYDITVPPKANVIMNCRPPHIVSRTVYLLKVGIGMTVWVCLYPTVNVGRLIDPKLEMGKEVQILNPLSGVQPPDCSGPGCPSECSHRIAGPAHSNLDLTFQGHQDCLEVSFRSSLDQAVRREQKVLVDIYSEDFLLNQQKESLRDPNPFIWRVNLVPTCWHTERLSKRMWTDSHATQQMDLESRSGLDFLAYTCPVWDFAVMDHLGPALPKMLFFSVRVSSTFESKLLCVSPVHRDMKGQQQESEGAGHVMSTARKQRVKNAGNIISFCGDAVED